MIRAAEGRLPDEPFQLGELNPAPALRPSVSGPVIVDNDVNWVARPSTPAWLAKSPTSSSPAPSARFPPSYPADISTTIFMVSGLPM